MMHIGQVMGDDEKTFLGLAGLGDLLATCSGKLSRNYTVGYSLGPGEYFMVINKKVFISGDKLTNTQATFTPKPRMRLCTIFKKKFIIYV